MKNIELRKSRGERIKYLLNRESIDADIDDFWKENKYFGSYLFIWLTLTKFKEIEDVLKSGEEDNEYSANSE